jgi:methyl-accepting chemotaxis protein/methyl-accepting chemotaxis protein-1 (serine sensor receptor)
MTIKVKLLGIYGVAMLLTIIMGFSAIFLFNSASSSVNRVIEYDAAKLSKSGELDTLAANVIANEQSMMLFTSLGDSNGAGTARRRLESNLMRFRELIDQFRPLLATEEGKIKIAKMEQQSDRLARQREEFQSVLQSGKMDQAQKFLTEQLVPTSSSMSEVASALSQGAKRRISESGADLKGTVYSGRMTASFLMLLSAGIGVWIYMVIMQLDKQLRHSVEELRQGSHQLRSAAGEVSSSSHSLARESSEQAAMIEETSASTEEINSMAKHNRENAQNATTLMEEAAKSTEESNREMAECVQAMKEIGDSSTRIANTLKLIDKIAFQTNILALNAAVEAARAGDAGMGFAVVAGEVRILAQQCATASQEISGLIDQSVGNSDAGRIKIAKLSEIGQKVNQVFTSLKVLVKEISLSSEEQGRGIEQIGRAVQKMEAGTQKSAANAEESAAAAEELNAQSKQLTQVAADLGDMVGLPDTTTTASTKHSFFRAAQSAHG